MTTQPQFHHRVSASTGSPDLLTGSQLKWLIGLVIISTGVFFLLAQADIIDYGSSWWAMYLGIPGLVFGFAAEENLRHTGRFNGMALVQIVLAVILLALTLIFVFDPTWSFTRGFALSNLFPFLNDIRWGTLWPWTIVIPGALIAGYSLLRRAYIGIGIGALVMFVGFTFVFNLNWGFVWPLPIIGFGVWLLFWKRPTSGKTKNDA